MAVSFKTDVVPLFTGDDIEHMANLGVMLDDYTYMSNPDNAGNVYTKVSTGQMPIDDGGTPHPWSPDKVSLLKAWMDGGYQP